MRTLRHVVACLALWAGCDVRFGPDDYRQSL